MRQALRAANAKARLSCTRTPAAIQRYYRPSYHAASAEDGWQRMLEWFKQYGGREVAVMKKDSGGITTRF